MPALSGSGEKAVCEFTVPRHLCRAYFATTRIATQIKAFFEGINQDSGILASAIKNYFLPSLFVEAVNQLPNDEFLNTEIYTCL